MRKLVFIIALCALALCAHAETLVLHTGARVKGQIVFQNEEVVIIRNAEGARFQYPRSEIEAILADEGVEVTGDGLPVTGEDQEIRTTKKASILLELAGGAACVPNETYGGAYSVDLLVGTHHIGERHIFIGGGLGYQGLQKWNFLPIQVAVRIPFLEQKHSPVGGVSVGYGLALSKDYLGGLYAGVDLGYRCQLNPKTAIGAVFFTRFQQAKILTEESVEGMVFQGKAGRNLLSFGAKFTLYF